MNGYLLTIRTFWYYLYVNMTKWQASRNIIYLYKLQNGTKIKKINHNAPEIPTCIWF